MNIELRKGERGVLIGQTGTGKSYLARRYLLPRTGRLLIIDPKAEWEFAGCEIFERVGEIEARNPERVIYQPTRRELRDRDAHDRIYDWAYRRGELFLYTDEIGSMLDGFEAPPAFHDVYARGRSRGITALTATQDPARVPLAIFRQARKFYAFRVVFPDDVKRMQQLIPGYTSKPPTPEEIAGFEAHYGHRIDPRFTFFYFDAETDAPARRMILTD
jgi:energy-coupling factor transporter ATP-binding protein EcfA2